MRASKERWKENIAVLLLLGLIGLFVGLGAYTFQYSKGFSYLSNSPKACLNCHIMGDQYNSWTKSSHHAVASCNDCHTPHSFPQKYLTKLENGWNHSKAFTLQNYDDPIRIRPVNLTRLQNNCIQCHEVAVGEITGHGNINVGDYRCTSCHRSVGHMSLD
jgi:cytochrome c nitrite reductase small subunit